MSNHSRGSWPVLLVVLVLLCSSANAQEAERSTPDGTSGEESAVVAESPQEQGLWPRHRLIYDSLTGLRLNPLGLETRNVLLYKLRLWDDPGLLFRDGYLGIDLTTTFSPASMRLGGGVHFKPLAVLLLAANAFWYNWVGAFQFLQSFDSPNAAHSDSDLERNADADLNYATGGLELELQVQVLAKVGPIVLRNDLKFLYEDQDLHAGDTVFYNSGIDALVPDKGWTLTNDTDLVYLSDFGLVAGVRGTTTHAFYPDEAFQPGEDPKANENFPSFRVGPLVAWVLSDDDERGPFSKPTVLLIANWWLVHPYRTGQDVSQAIPYFAVGFKFGGEVWSSAQ